MISLPYEVVLYGPTALEFACALFAAVADAGEICQQSVSPNIGNMAFIEGQRNAPIEGRTGDGKIFQAALNEGYDFVLTGFRTNEIRVFLVELQQRLLEFGKLEEPISSPPAF